MADHKLEEIIKRLREIPHVDVIRLGTRTLWLCPSGSQMTWSIC